MLVSLYRVSITISDLIGRKVIWACTVHSEPTAPGVVRPVFALNPGDFCEACFEHGWQTYAGPSKGWQGTLARAFPLQENVSGGVWSGSDDTLVATVEWNAMSKTFGVRFGFTRPQQAA